MARIRSEFEVVDAVIFLGGEREREVSERVRVEKEG